MAAPQCCITSQNMTDPVIDKDGYTYERAAIEQWLHIHGTSPMTRQSMTVDELRPNRAVLNAISELTVDELGPRRPVLNAISELGVENSAESEKKELSDSSSKASQVEKSKMLPHMDKNNALIARVWAEKGVEEAVKQMFVHPEDGSSLGYAEMRSFYG